MNDYVTLEISKATKVNRELLGTKADILQKMINSIGLEQSTNNESISNQLTELRKEHEI